MLMISVDDKAIVPIGEPHQPVSTGVRGHNRSLVVANLSTLKALDHDFHVSVAFSPRIPSEARDSFFSGPVFVTLKDKVITCYASCNRVEQNYQIKFELPSSSGSFAD
jgi:hypothetical protein